MFSEAVTSEKWECSLCSSPLRPRWKSDRPFNILDCPICDLGHTWPAPAEANGEEGFADNDVHYERQYSERRELWRGFAARLLDRVPASHRSGRLLDVGSGVGLLVELAGERGAQACGIDRAPAAGRVARSHGVDVRSCELSDLDEDEFDVVVMMHVLEHVPDPVGFLRDAACRLRPGGILLVNVPISSGLMPRLLGRRWYGFQPTQHVHQFSPRSLRAVAARAGLTPHRIASESLHYDHPVAVKRCALITAALIGRLAGLGDQATLMAYA